MTYNGIRLVSSFLETSILFETFFYPMRAFLFVRQMSIASHFIPTGMGFFFSIIHCIDINGIRFGVCCEKESEFFLFNVEFVIAFVNESEYFFVIDEKKLSRSLCTFLYRPLGRCTYKSIRKENEWERTGAMNEDQYSTFQAIHLDLGFNQRSYFSSIINLPIVARFDQIQFFRTWRFV